MSLLDTRPSNPRRPVDWRWLRAGYAEQQPDISRRWPHDPKLTLAREIRRAIAQCQSERDLDAFASYYPDEFEAWAVYTGSDVALVSRWELEARLTANERVLDIAKKFNMTPATVNLYHDLFFDVRRILGSPSVLTHCVFAVPSAEGRPSLDSAGLWKMTGYWAGPQVLDNLIYTLSGNESSQVANTFYDERFRLLLARKAFMTVLDLKVNSFNAIETMGLFLQLKTIERGEDKMALGEQAYTNNIDIFFGNMPWQRAYVYQQEQSRLALTDQRSVSLRDSELADFAAMGHAPVDVERILASAEEVPFGNN